MFKVKKRDGSIVEFNVMKIAKAIFKSRLDENQDVEVEDCVSEAKEIVIEFKGREIVKVEEIQDAIERYFLKKEELDVFKSFIFYREKRKQDRLNPWANNDERQDLILQKYLIKGETKSEFLDRVTIGNGDLLKIFRNKEGIWGGRNLYAIGRDGNITGSNCYVGVHPEDSLEDIYRAAYDIARTYSYGGGQGLNLSALRPKGAKVNNSSNSTPGVMTFAELYSFITLNTQQESRRGALMLVLDDNHPDLIDFITSKLDLNKVNGANISIAISHGFMKALKEDDFWELKFETNHETIIKRMLARDIMKLVSYSAHTMGDPGVLFIDTVNEYHLLSEYSEVNFTCTNPCGE